ncbi:hypothetical protein E1211_17925 [Micromonospora sp. 15K316]|uniref:hypothetical protein n=1 Tax=Micromonospora sp. 15K316 TaxID=2530376 RepID=UPI001045ABC4|nr:hypothetical protein [Micromonospora sp. 15K316]TDC34225.1 hypothetical protein E1211_17925 [Micromonospora sp. 15K316]
MNVTTATPVEIDTQLADIDRRAAQAEQSIAAAAVTIHYALGERPRYVTRTRRERPTSDTDAITAARAHGDERVPRMAAGYTYADLVRKYDTAVNTLAAIEAEATPLNAEFARRGGWSRFFTVQQHNGHIHSHMACSTCNRNGQRTAFAWNPELSGLSQAEAIAKFDRRAYVLCTVCYPNAPVEWTVRPPRPTKQERERQAQEAARHARINDPKLIGTPDGEVLKVDGAVLRTVRSAEIAYVNAMFWAEYSRRNGTANPEDGEHAAVIAAALAAKAGTTVEQVEQRLAKRVARKVAECFGK